MPGAHGLFKRSPVTGLVVELVEKRALERPSLNKPRFSPGEDHLVKLVISEHTDAERCTGLLGRDVRTPRSRSTDFSVEM